MVNVSENSMSDMQDFKDNIFNKSEPKNHDIVDEFIIDEDGDIEM